MIIYNTILRTCHYHYMQLDFRQAPAGLREGNYESDQEFTICNCLLGWTWAGKSELGKRSESNLERRKGGVVEKQWYHVFGQDLTTSGACDSGTEGSRLRRRKAEVEGKGAKLPVLFTTSTHSTQTELCCVQCAPPAPLPAALLPGSRQTCDLESAQAKLHCKLKNTKYRALVRHLTPSFNLPRIALTISYLWKTFYLALTKHFYIRLMKASIC